MQMLTPVSKRKFSLTAAWAFNQLAYAIVYPFIPLYLSNERGIPYTTVSLIFPLLGLAVILAPIPCGWMTDKWGRNLMMQTGQYGRGLIFFIMAAMVYFNAPFWAFAVILMLNTAVGVAFQVGADAYLADTSTEAERPMYYSWIRMGFNFGWAAGPMLGAFFARTPFWLFFIITALLSAAGGLFTHFTCCKDAAQYTRSIKKDKITPDEPVLKTIFQNKRFLLLLAGTCLLMCLASQLYSTMSIYSTTRIGISKTALGSIYSLNGFLVMALQIPLIALLKRCKLPLAAQLLLGVLLYGTGFAALGFSSGAWMIACAVAVLTLGEIIDQPALFTTVSNETTPANAGRLMASYSLSRGVGYAIGPWIGAQLMAHLSSNILLWSMLSSFALMAAMIFLIAVPHRPQIRQEAEL
ncbi:MAG: MFS transporter [Lentisphaeria bacterium]|nr:MFS transporter [Lentisphaeria bacterium]